jgi:3-oxoacyl-[acyl-carrier-protein] synthase II
MNSLRIVITGIGCVSPAGTGREVLLNALRLGNSLSSRIDTFRVKNMPPAIGFVVPDFDPKLHLNIHQIKRLDRSGQFFISAGKMAIFDSGLMSAGYNQQRTGIFEGSSVGGLNSILDEHVYLMDHGPERINPFMIIKGMNGIAGSLLAAEYKINGPVLNFSNGSVSSATAIYTAFHMLRSKELDAAITGGSEAPINYNMYSIFSKAGAMCTQYDLPEKACRPFDISRSGLVPGEGGGCIIMERMEDAVKRNAKIYAEILGVSMSNDAYNPVAPAEDAFQQSQSIRMVLERSGISKEELGFIAAHGTSTCLNDRIECLALHTALGNIAETIPLTAMKSILGHSLGACTIIEMIGGILSMNHGFIPMIANLEQPEPNFNLNFVKDKALQKDVNSFLIKNSSFGGKNTAILLKSFS